MAHDENKEFDGIRQLDNPLPSWWKWIFIISIVFAPIYAVYFHFYSNWGTEDHFKNEVKTHLDQFPLEKEVVANADGVNPLREDATAIKEGEIVFKNFCSACHGVNAEGLIGPNLMDKDWIHGNTDLIVFQNIMKGIAMEQTKLGKGPMPPHESSLGSEKVYQVMSWLANKNSSLKEK